MGSIAPSWQDKAAAKRQAVLDLIPVAWRLPQPLPAPKDQKDVTGAYVQQFLSPREVELTEADVTQIVSNTTSGTWTATEVVTAFCHRAAIAHQLTNCLHEIFFSQAIAEAKLLDAKFAASGGVASGPLHGVPVSFKDQFHVRGVETTMGYVGWIGTFEGKKGTGKEKVVESELVREIRALGGVPFCKTSLPHTVMSGVTWNHIVGFTRNPNNRLMTCGGSSGGEGALVAMKGSPVGFGTDIGGSIRIPSAFNGLYGIRPSFGRLPYAGAANSMPGQNSVPSVCGPLAGSAATLKLVLKSVLAQQPWLYDPAIVELPWRDNLAAALPATAAELGQVLTFGLWEGDDQVAPTPPVKRAFATVKALIETLGHQTIEWTPPSHTRATELAMQAFIADGGIDIHYHIGLSGEPLQWRVAELYGTAPKAPTTADQLFDGNLELFQYRRDYMDYWNSTAALTKSGRPVDAILAPVAPGAAVELDNKNFHVGYTPWVNTLDYTAAVFPVTRVDPAIDVVEKDYTPLNDLDKAIHEEYTDNPQVQENTPVGLQLVGRRFQEEKILALVEMLSTALAQS
ncbi:amidase [Sporothrix schenckii 1099-18]|uniref:amidase n=1 Tax=Sporothrix schenckii 1099-18 TaxID=1397361 RepID=A0A0F2LW27_SPOSC|nr:amidase [Sporothrix schenckii 1099-18]KJR81677.1 amidase [Sporothrix schenckii 1099-18]